MTINERANVGLSHVILLSLHITQSSDHYSGYQLFVKGPYLPYFDTYNNKYSEEISIRLKNTYDLMIWEQEECE